jgi:hypothetical protein
MLLYSTDWYSLTDTAKFGLTMMFIAWGMSVPMGDTYYRLLGYLPARGVRAVLRSGLRPLTRSIALRSRTANVTI